MQRANFELNWRFFEKAVLLADAFAAVLFVRERTKVLRIGQLVSSATIDTGPERLHHEGQ